MSFLRFRRRSRSSKHALVHIRRRLRSFGARDDRLSRKTRTRNINKRFDCVFARRLDATTLHFKFLGRLFPSHLSLVFSAIESDFLINRVAQESINRVLIRFEIDSISGHR